jgi:dipeptidyl aminopeptidase/acylaminoacyl peptidase
MSRVRRPNRSSFFLRVVNPDADDGRAFLIDRSPVNHIERATRPILIAHGLNDVPVVVAESRQMVDALKGRKTPVTYVTFRDEGHGFVRPVNRLVFFAVAAMKARECAARTRCRSSVYNPDARGLVR